MEYKLLSISVRAVLLIILSSGSIFLSAQSSIYGRAWNTGNLPLKDAYIFVSNPEQTKLYGCVTTLAERQGKQPVGSFRLEGLPANTPLHIYAFNSYNHQANCTQTLSLKANESRMVILDVQQSGMMSNTADKVYQRLYALYKSEISTSARGMKVVLTSESILPQGSSKSFIHQISLSGLPDLANQGIGVEDPVSRQTIKIQTNAYGVATYSCRPAANLQPGAYAIVFSLGNQKIFSTVIVSPSGNLPTTVLKDFKIRVGIYDQTDPNFSILPGTYRMKDYSTPLTKSINAAVDFGIAVAEDYLSNPGNIGIVVITAITCSAGQAVPFAGQVACAAGIKSIETGFALTAAKVAANNWIDASTSMTDIQKANWKEAVALGSCAISLAKFDPASGLVDVGIIGKSWTAGKTVSKLMSLEANKEALSIAGQINGTNEVVQISMVKPKEAIVKNEVEMDFFTDPRDGHKYKTVKIGNQVWMAENLAYLPWVSPSAAGSTTAPYFYVYGYSGTSISAAKATANYTTYGVLYNWEAAKVSSPPGWHLPSEVEWKQLEMSLGMTQVQADASNSWRGSDQGKMLKNTAGWNNNGNGSNTSGFSALPGGQVNGNGVFWDINTYGHWQTSSQNGSDAWRRSLGYDNQGINRYYTWKNCAYSVRCVKDSETTGSIPTNGLVAYYPFNGNANDESGNGNNGTVYNATLVKNRTGNKNSAYELKGTGSKIVIANNPFFNSVNQITVSVWANPTTTWTYNAQHVLSKEVKDNYGLSFGFDQNNSVYGTGNYAIFLQIIKPNGYDYIYKILTPAELPGWKNIVFTIDGNTMKIFLNGNEVATKTVATNLQIINSGVINIGTRAIRTDQWYKGYVDDVRIYNRTLSAHEIQALYKE